MSDVPLFATTELELRGHAERLQVRIFAPAWDKDRAAWACRIEVDPPFSLQQSVYGESGLQALSLAMKVMASALYGSRAYKERQLGAFGEYGGYLGFAAPKEALGHAPYPF